MCYNFNDLKGVLLKMKIDHEEYKLKIKITKSSYILLRQDMWRFGYIRGENELNYNGFINTLIPKMYRYRKYHNKKLMKVLQNYLGNEIDSDVIEIVNDAIYDDSDIGYFSEVMNLRISKENMKLYDRILMENQKNKSYYIRSLVNQYSNLKLDVRETIFFNDYYNIICENIYKRKIIFHFDDCSMEIFPIDLRTCVITGEIYIFGVINKQKKIYIQSFRICEIRKINISNKIDLILKEETKDKIDKYIYDLEYLESSEKEIGDCDHGDI